jgi:hypothetical protein
MIQERLQKVLLSPGFLAGLALLLLNDFVLKDAFGNWWTGKLSDFSGLFIFPLFLYCFLPKPKAASFIFTTVLFLLWKTTYSQALIDELNLILPLTVGRVVDHSDFWALFAVPLSYLYLLLLYRGSISSFRQQFVIRTIVFLITIFSFTATTLVRDRMLELEGDYAVSEHADSITTILKNNPNIYGIRIQREDEVFNSPKADKGTYFFDFKIKRRLCDSESPEYSFIVMDDGSTSTLRAGFVHFECNLYEGNGDQNALDKEFKAEVESVFKSEVLDRLSVQGQPKPKRQAGSK